MISKRTEGFFRSSGFFMTAIAAAFQAGLLIGAETTPVAIVSDIRTPGLVGPSLAVTPKYAAFWEAATAAALAGLILLFISYLPSLRDELAN